MLAGWKGGFPALGGSSSITDGESRHDIRYANANGRDGIIAFARGKNATLPSALCETERGTGMLVALLARDGGRRGRWRGFREENHCTHTDEPLAYVLTRWCLRAAAPGKTCAKKYTCTR